MKKTPKNENKTNKSTKYILSLIGGTNPEEREVILQEIKTFLVDNAENIKNIKLNLIHQHLDAINKIDEGGAKQAKEAYLNDLIKKFKEGDKLYEYETVQFDNYTQNDVAEFSTKNLLLSVVRSLYSIYYSYNKNDIELKQKNEEFKFVYSEPGTEVKKTVDANGKAPAPVPAPAPVSNEDNEDQLLEGAIDLDVVGIPLQEGLGTSEAKAAPKPQPKAETKAKAIVEENRVAAEEEVDDEFEKIKKKEREESEQEEKLLKDRFIKIRDLLASLYNMLNIIKTNKELKKKLKIVNGKISYNDEESSSNKSIKSNDKTFTELNLIYNKYANEYTNKYTKLFEKYFNENGFQREDISIDLNDITILEQDIKNYYNLLKILVPGYDDSKVKAFLKKTIKSISNALKYLINKANEKKEAQSVVKLSNKSTPNILDSAFDLLPELLKVKDDGGEVAAAPKPIAETEEDIEIKDKLTELHSVLEKVFQMFNIIETNDKLKSKLKVVGNKIKFRDIGDDPNKILKDFNKIYSLKDEYLNFFIFYKEDNKQFKLKKISKDIQTLNNTFTDEKIDRYYNLLHILVPGYDTVGQKTILDSAFDLLPELLKVKDVEALKTTIEEEKFIKLNDLITQLKPILNIIETNKNLKSTLKTMNVEGRRIISYTETNPDLSLVSAEINEINEIYNIFDSIYVRYFDENGNRREAIPNSIDEDNLALQKILDEKKKFNILLNTLVPGYNDGKVIAFFKKLSSKPVKNDTTEEEERKEEEEIKFLKKNIQDNYNKLFEKNTITSITLEEREAVEAEKVETDKIITELNTAKKEVLIVKKTIDDLKEDISQDSRSFKDQFFTNKILKKKIAAEKEVVSTQDKIIEELDKQIKIKQSSIDNARSNKAAAEKEELDMQNIQTEILDLIAVEIAAPVVKVEPGARVVQPTSDIIARRAARAERAAKKAVKEAEKKSKTQRIKDAELAVEVAEGTKKENLNTLYKKLLIAIANLEKAEDKLKVNQQETTKIGELSTDITQIKRTKDDHTELKNKAENLIKEFNKNPRDNLERIKKEANAKLPKANKRLDLLKQNINNNMIQLRKSDIYFKNLLSDSHMPPPAKSPPSTSPHPTIQPGGGKLAKYKSTRDEVYILYKKRRYKKTVYVKENTKTKYCKINSKFYMLSKLKVIG